MFKTTDKIIEEVRGDLDEIVGGTWSPDDLLTWLNAGLVRIQSKLRGVREDWFTTTIKSTDSSLTILGEIYNPSALQLVSGTSDYTVPSDTLEIRTIRPTDATHINRGVKFLHRDISSLEFISARSTTASENRSTFFFDLIGLNTVRFAPTPAETIDIEIDYIRYRDNYDFGEDVDIIPSWAYGALKEFIVYRAYKAISHPDTNSQLGRFKDELEEGVSDFGKPRQSQDPVISEGIWDDDDLAVRGSVFDE